MESNIINYKTLMLGIAAAVLSMSCKGQTALERALKAAGENRPEIERVLAHYAGNLDESGNTGDSGNANNSGDHDRTFKLRAAEFLVENMPGHYTYAGDDVAEFYKIGEQILTSGLDPRQQNDSIARLVAKRFPRLQRNAVKDITIIKADYLIKNIEDAFTLWRTKPWARHLDFGQFCEYLLPYKFIDGQPFDHWRDTLAGRFGNHLTAQTYNDENYDSPFHASQLVRRSLQEQVVAITGHTATPAFLSASTIYKLSYGWCSDYALLAVAAMRSLGVPVVHFNVPQWGRNRVGHDSYALLNDRGESLISPWDFSTEPGGAFFINERIPKIYHTTYSINRDREEYHAKAKYRHPFDLFQRDATDVYLAAVDVSVPVIRRSLFTGFISISPGS